MVIHSDLPGLFSEVGADIGFHARITTQSELGSVAVFTDNMKWIIDNIKRITIPILHIGVEDATASESSTDGELEIVWDCPAFVNVSEGPEEILELISGILIS